MTRPENQPTAAITNIYIHNIRRAIHAIKGAGQFPVTARRKRVNMNFFADYYPRRGVIAVIQCAGDIRLCLARYNHNLIIADTFYLKACYFGFSTHGNF